MTRRTRVQPHGDFSRERPRVRVDARLWAGRYARWLKFRSIPVRGRRNDHDGSDGYHITTMSVCGRHCAAPTKRWKRLAARTAAEPALSQLRAPENGTTPTDRGVAHDFNNLLAVILREPGSGRKSSDDPRTSRLEGAGPRSRAGRNANQTSTSLCAAPGTETERRNSKARQTCSIFAAVGRSDNGHSRHST